MPAPVPYYLTEEFCRANGHLNAAELFRTFHDVAKPTWRSRRGAMRDAFPDLVPRVGRDGKVLPITAPDATPQPEPLSMHDQVELDREAIEAAEQARREKAEYARALKAHSVYRKLVAHGQDVLAPLTPICCPPKVQKAPALIR